MGSDDAQANAKPVHSVTVRTFYIMKTDVTVAQYAECVRGRRCSEPGKGRFCNWGKTGHDDHPINCVTWGQAHEFARFAGARLPSEAEWEYAARGGGLPIKFPWGNEPPPDCDHVVMHYAEIPGCHERGTLPVCSRPLGNTRQGLCDMIGNVLQWVEDASYDTYDGAPTDGSAWQGDRPYREIRGGAFFIGGTWFLHAASRSRGAANTGGRFLGFRLAKDAKD